MAKVVFSIRVDERIKAALDNLANKDDQTRNRLIEQVLAEKCGVILPPRYQTEDEDD